MGEVMIPATALSAVAMGLLMLGLACRVSLLRVRGGVSLGDGDNRDLRRAIRSHANTVEFAPIFLVMLLSYELIIGPCLYASITAAVFVVSRFIYSWGMWSQALSRRRQIGAGLSYLCLLVMAILLVLAVFAWS